LLFRLFDGCFRDDEDREAKINFVGELAGCAASAFGTKIRSPKMTVFKGERAENGKSALLDLLCGMLPPEAVASVPASKFSDNRHVVHLVGKYLNRRDEVSSAAVISSDAAKNIVTGEPITGRDVYKSAVVFRPTALHVFACNTLPSFTGGLDRGVQRRLALLQFNRVIPDEEKIPAIGQRVAAEEPDLLLAFAVAGMQRLLRQVAFTVPRSSERGLREWFLSGDPVIAWVQARLRPRDPAEYLEGARDPGISMSALYADFNQWQRDVGYGAAFRSGFGPRLRSQRSSTLGAAAGSIASCSATCPTPRPPTAKTPSREVGRRCGVITITISPT
jgi:phage/plasmid-associated DNA primase